MTSPDLEEAVRQVLALLRLGLRRHLGLAEAVGLVGAELGEGLVGRAVVVGGGGRDQVELGAELEQVLGLLLGVGGVEGLDPVGAEAADQVVDLARARRCPSRGGR